MRMDLDDYHAGDEKMSSSPGGPTSNEEIQELFNRLVAEQDFSQIEQKFGREAVSVARKLAFEQNGAKHKKQKHLDIYDADEEAAIDPTAVRDYDEPDFKRGKGKSVDTSRGLGRSSTNRTGAGKWVPPSSKTTVPSNASQSTTLASGAKQSKHFKTANEKPAVRPSAAKPPIVQPMANVFEDGDMFDAVHVEQPGLVTEYLLPTGDLQGNATHALPIVTNQTNHVQVSLQRASRESVTSTEPPYQDKCCGIQSDSAFNTAADTAHAESKVQACSMPNEHSSPTISTKQNIDYQEEPKRFREPLDAITPPTSALYISSDVVPAQPKAQQEVQPPRPEYHFNFPRDRNPPERFATLPACYFLHDILFL